MVIHQDLVLFVEYFNHDDSRSFLMHGCCPFLIWLRFFVAFAAVGFRWQHIAMALLSVNGMHGVSGLSIFLLPN